MPKLTNCFELRYGARSPAQHLAVLAMLSFLLILLTACSTAPRNPGVLRPEMPDQSLLADCSEGPSLPPGKAARVDDLAPVVKARDAAAAVCRLRHKALADYVRRAVGLKDQSTP